MAAEKLTKERIAQILIMMALLVTAFWWRTFEYTAPRHTTVSCNMDSLCDIHESLTNVQLSKDNTQLVMQDIPIEWIVSSSLIVERKDELISINVDKVGNSSISIILKNRELAQDIQLTIDLD